MKQRIIFISILFAVLLYSCTKTVVCPGFSDELYQYVDYELNDKMKFTNGTDTIDLIVNYVYGRNLDENTISRAETTFCDSELTFTMQHNNKQFMALGITDTWNFGVLTSFYKSSGQANNYSTLNTYSDKLTDKTYHEVMLIQTEEHNQNGGVRLIFDKEHNLIRAFCNNFEEAWYLIENE